MKPYIFTLTAVALIAAHLTSCKSTQTYSYGNSPVRINLSATGDTNVCTCKTARAQRKCLDYYNYRQALKKSYDVKIVQDTTSEPSNIAAAPYLLIRGGK